MSADKWIKSFRCKISPVPLLFIVTLRRPPATQGWTDTSFGFPAVFGDGGGGGGGDDVAVVGGGG